MEWWLIMKNYLTRKNYKRTFNLLGLLLILDFVLTRLVLTLPNTFEWNSLARNIGIIPMFLISILVWILSRIYFMKRPSITNRIILIFMTVYYLWVNLNHFGVSYSVLNNLNATKIFTPSDDNSWLIVHYLPFMNKK